MPSPSSASWTETDRLTTDQTAVRSDPKTVHRSLRLRRRSSVVESASSGRPVPICHVQVLPILSGVQRVMLDIFRCLDRERYAPHVICREFGPLTDELQEQRIPHTVIPALDRPIHPWKDYRALRELRAVFRRHQFQIVHTHSSKPGILARLAAHQVGIPHILHHVHSFAFHEFSPRLQRFIYSRLEKWAGRMTERVVFVNNEERLMSIQQGWLPRAKCETVYNGVDLSALEKVDAEAARRSFRQAHGIDDDELVILTLGRLETPKQPLIFPEIARQLETLCPDRPWRIVVAGSGSYEQALRQKIQQLAVGRRFKLAGWQTDSFPALLASDILLQPSLWEGLPVSVIEAHAVGIPTVASDVKGNREVVSESTGFLCRPRNPLDYATALHQLLVNPLLRRACGVEAGLRAETLFDAQVNMSRIVDIYDELVNQTASPAQIARAA